MKEQKTKNFILRLTEEEFMTLHKAAHEQGTTASNITRLALFENYLKMLQTSRKEGE